MTDRSSVRNRLRAALPAAEYEALRPQLEPVSVPIRETIYEPGQPLPYVLFPNSGVYSLLTEMSDGNTLEIATVSREGMLGLPVLLEAETIPSRAICQIASEALRMETAAFREALRRPGVLPTLLYRYAQGVFNQVAQTAGCNHAHTLDERCARWLLMSHDGVDGDQFDLTQEFLAMMLGVRRPSVSVAASILQRAGLIHYSRGRITVLDRPGLEAAACECYAVIRQEFDRLIPRVWRND
jgi:CRP-like cAMP-binding protein